MDPEPKNRPWMVLVPQVYAELSSLLWALQSRNILARMFTYLPTSRFSHLPRIDANTEYSSTQRLVSIQLKPDFPISGHKLIRVRKSHSGSITLAPLSDAIKPERAPERVPRWIGTVLVMLL